MMISPKYKYLLFLTYDLGEIEQEAEVPQQRRNKQVQRELGTYHMDHMMEQLRQIPEPKAREREKEEKKKRGKYGKQQSEMASNSQVV